MPRKTSDTSPSKLDVQAKQAFPLTERLNKLITDTTALRKHLGCTSQTISQYKTGTARPSLENLCKIADYYGVSTDYLLGRSDIPNTDENIQAVHKLVGLSAEAIKHLERIKNTNPELRAVLSIFLAIFNLDYFLSLLRSRFQYAAPEYHIPPEIKMEDGVAHIKNTSAYHESISKREVKVQFDGISLTADKANLLESMITASLLADLKEMAETYLDRQKKGEL